MKKIEVIIRTIGLSAVLISGIYYGLYVRDNEFNNSVKKPVPAGKEVAVVNHKCADVTHKLCDGICECDGMNCNY